MVPYLNIFIILISTIFSIVACSGHSQNFNNNDNSNIAVLDIKKNEIIESNKLIKEAREEVGLTNGFIYDEELAKYAEEYAKVLASNGRWEHDPKNNTGYYNGKILGENLAARSIVKDNGLAWANKMWIDEKNFYTYGPVPEDDGDNSTCEPGKQCGHYTQIIWKDTTRYGCAKVVYDNPNSNFNNWELIVCKYYKPGNYIGEYPY